MKIRSLLLVGLLAASCQAVAALYKSIDEDGNVVFSDQPSEGAEPVKLEPINVMDSLQTPSSDSDAATDGTPPEVAAVTYDVTITQPETDTTIRANDGNIMVSVSLDPPLKEGHQLWYKVDGEPMTASAATSTVLKNVNRGTHAITVSVVDENSKPISTSAAITIHLMRVSIHSTN